MLHGKHCQKLFFADKRRKGYSADFQLLLIKGADFFAFAGVIYEQPLKKNMLGNI